MSCKNEIDGRFARREYMRRWRAEHPESVRAAQDRYWEKKAAELRSQVQPVEDRAQAEQ